MKHIKVEAKVFGCHDTSIFEGPEEEMKPIFSLVYFYLSAFKDHHDLVLNATVELTKKIPNSLGGNPMFLTMAGPLMMGGNFLKAAVLLSCGIQDKEDLKIGLSVDIEDLVAAVQLSKEGLCSFQEALAL